MKNNKIAILFLIFGLLIGMNNLFAQRVGGLPRGSVSKHLISNGPQGPIQGGESAVTDMVLMSDGWVYGGTKATWGAQNCHLFRTDGDTIQHLLNITSQLAGQTSVSDLAQGEGKLLFGGTSTYNEVFDANNKKYPGGHLFSFDPESKKLEDLGIISAGQGY